MNTHSGPAGKSGGGLGTIFVTRAAIRRAADELDEIIEEKLPALRRAIAASEQIKEGGGQERSALLEDFRELEARKAELEAFLSQAEALPPGSTQQVEIGSRVAIVDLGTQEERTLTIVSTNGDPKEGGMISIGAPVAKALLGCCVGDAVEVPTVDQRKVQRLQITAIGEGDP